MVGGYGEGEREVSGLGLHGYQMGSESLTNTRWLLVMYVF